MEVIYIDHPHTFKREDFEPMVLALGFFDGVHYGHQKVIGTAVEIGNERGLKKAVMTFYPHPSVVLRRDKKQVKYITPLEEKQKLIEELGVDYLFVVKFTKEFADLLPQEFVDQYIIGLNAVHVVAGFDYTYGKMGRGTMETLRFHSREQFVYTVVKKLTNGNEKISSTLIRSYIRAGKVDRLPEILSRYYKTKGIVIHGDKRGRTIGFPTANVKIDDDYMLPPVGVYVVRTFVQGKWYNGICNVGYKPTFRKDTEGEPTIEVHLFDFDEQIYGEKVTIEWHQFIRSEKKFSNIDELVAQLEADTEKAKQYFYEKIEKSKK